MVAVVPSEDKVGATRRCSRPASSAGGAVFMWPPAEATVLLRRDGLIACANTSCFLIVML